MLRACVVRTRIEFLRECCMLGRAHWIGILMQDKENKSLPIVESSNVTENSGVDMVGRRQRRFLGVFLHIHMTISMANAL